VGDNQKKNTHCALKCCISEIGAMESDKSTESFQKEYLWAEGIQKLVFPE